MIIFLPLSNIRQDLLNMEASLDALWFKIIDIVEYIKQFLDIILAPLNFFGPGIVISTIAFITVILTKILTKTFKTKRYRKLQKEFSHWYNIRQEALKCEDHDKGKVLARNIDQGKLNQVYYNYFFEGFMLGIATKYLPILIVLAYVNESYKSSNLRMLFGREYIFKFGSSNGEVVVIGAVFWFIISIVMIYLGWFIIGRIYRKYVKGIHGDKKDHPYINETKQMSNPGTKKVAILWYEHKFKCLLIHDEIYCLNNESYIFSYISIFSSPI